MEIQVEIDFQMAQALKNRKISSHHVLGTEECSLELHVGECWRWIQLMKSGDCLNDWEMIGMKKKSAMGPLDPIGPFVDRQVIYGWEIFGHPEIAQAFFVVPVAKALCRGCGRQRKQ